MMTCKSSSMINIIIFLAILRGAMLLVASSSSEEATKSIFLLAGQSNMVGQGGVMNGKWDGVVPPQCQARPSMLRLNNQLLWEEAREPLHQGIRYSNALACGIGPGMAFANSILERDRSIGVVALVPCASAGMNISQWRRASTLYSQLINRARAAVSDGGGRIRGMLWYQGESDSVTLEDAKLYKQRLEMFFTDVRRDLMLPQLPVIQVAIASGGNYIDIIREAQLETELDNVKCVDAKGLELIKPQNIHLSTTAQVQLGAMLAEAFLQCFRQ